MSARSTRFLILIVLLAVFLAACSGSAGDSADDDVDAAQPQSAEEQLPEAGRPASPAPTMLSSAAPEVALDAVGAASGGSDGAPPPSRALNAVQSAPPQAPPPQAPQNQPAPAGTPDAMTFDDPGTNPFLDTADDNLSTFAMDVDSASYTLARSYLMNNGSLPPDEAIRPEEFINYFDANYPSPEEGSFGITLDAAPAPFGYDGHYLLRVGIQGRYIAPEDRDPALLIFVIDVSGSMDREDRLGTVKQSLELLTGELREDDRVGIVVYSSQSRAVLDPTPASDNDTIMRAIDALQPEGSTNVEEGLRLGYDMARQSMRDGENTRVIVLSDGVANVGATGPDAILETVRDGVDSGITLSTIGFGMGNFNDVLMEQLANDGNGNYYYVDTLNEARRVFVHNLTGTLQVIGYDAKIQVEFHAGVTDRYRLIGYENRAIADTDFRNDEVDAGEVGAGHSVTALYELALQDGEDFDADAVIATARIRYEDADTREVVEQEASITVGDVLASMDEAPASFRLHAAAAEFAELLGESFWAQEGNFGDVRALAESVREDMPDDETVANFIEMVRAATRIQDA